MLPTSTFIVILTSIAHLTLSVPVLACNKTLLLAASDAYIASQTSGSLTSLQPYLSTNWSYIENNKATDPNKSVLSKALKIDHRRTNTDLVACATYNEIIITDSSNPYVIGTQLRHDDAEGKITLIDSIASTTNSWLFDAKKTLQYVWQEKWDVIPEGKRDSRAVIQAAGDAYMDMWNDASAPGKVPWGTPCVRLEGSAYTGTGKPDDSCKPGIPSNHSQPGNTHRRYVIDESMGSAGRGKVDICAYDDCLWWKTL
ncbi:hypothetical protein ONS95_007458 [Cadophora gregata]|uniref:uncharacterized protein n=1 Tax=Cadophora gregata TaxID=51156 RepID=UPI0026DBAC1A|nr:uncharacterized protein ONS95_007458 [Cadophora gregata]KAK0118572.1 hypothetical protein ONS96_011664 [Cadophora gregata f. sp. sojae]KAK0125827.1 hypothetical protein ONS95_007458 [Cadophora gregata]